MSQKTVEKHDNIVTFVKLHQIYEELSKLWADNDIADEAQDMVLEALDLIKKARCKVAAANKEDN